MTASATPVAPIRKLARVRRWLMLFAIAYIGVLILLLSFENRLVFRACTALEDWQPPPSDAIEDVTLQSKDGARIHAWYCPQAGDAALLYLHGNAGNLSHRGNSIIRMSQELQKSILIIDYPGYGKSDGQPTEAGCYQAADAAYAWLREEKKFAAEKIWLFGGSLGGAVAIDLASRERVAGLIVAKTFTSAPDIGARQFPWLPIRWLMRNRFDNLAKIKHVTCPVFLCHGPDDRVVPYELGHKLFEAANEPKTWFVLEGQDHNDPLGADFFTAVKTFVNSVHNPQSEQAMVR